MFMVFFSFSGCKYISFILTVAHGVAPPYPRFRFVKGYLSQPEKQNLVGYDFRRLDS
ncbi:hypothetical protein QDY71_04765 [Kingella negevensis]|uniref:hypothetical protein n=1 Tax=Kingella negevensis TaxID=1522312 RepID=UPI000A99DB65|nr:hypothetical protein [Kingella negevensis]MDK4697076.1 hypothetical protein [Kingella negevensis]